MKTPYHFDSIKEAYDQVMAGVSVPSLVVTNGEVLNEILKCSLYDPNSIYHMTKNGITRVELDD